ncbi:dual specificity protein phosphatase 14-like [Triplophysa rosa]|uniref:dual specificity protein phosphatase 14-like n=1 Tax=Triplophysa rosa TaxID=992332 RepID=UPI0025460FB1|nr:dual specificity protein phosphatase 14-like [Triplophysa rosa]
MKEHHLQLKLTKTEVLVIPASSSIEHHFTAFSLDLQLLHLPITRMISQVTPSLYLSGVEALNQSALSHRGITLLVNACAEYPCPQYQGVDCICVPVEDQPHAPLDQHFDSVAERIHQNRSGSSLVFCSAGRSRSPSLIMAFLMRFEGISLLQAHQQVLVARPFIRPNAGFWRQLLRYEKKLTQRNSIKMVATSQGVLPETIQPIGDSLCCLNV